MPPPRLRNGILDRLPRHEVDMLQQGGERVQLANRQVVAEPGRPLDFVYFPLSSIFSALIVLKDGMAVEAATFGSEGMVSVGFLVEETASPYRILQEVDGETLRLPAAPFRRLLAQSTPLHQLLIRYCMTLLRQSGQNAACNLRHGIEERMCRWLLATSDRTGRDEFDITQEFMAEMLGVRRQTVNLTARLLQARGLVDYRRGRLTITDRPGMEESACECYRSQIETYNRLMSLPHG